MKTDDLISVLASDPLAEPRVMSGVVWPMAGALVFCVAAVGAVLGFRSDLAAAAVTPVSALRWVLGLSLLILGMQAVVALARPGGRGRFWPLAMVVSAAAAAVLWALRETPRADWATETVGETMLHCLTLIPALSVAPVAVLLLALRRGATTVPRLAGAMAGMAGAGGAAAAYALHCPDDSPLFYVTWYGLAILMVTLVSGWIGGRLLRW